MIDHPINFQLPAPWNGQTFETQRLGAINFLVGPNGAGKSLFVNHLRGHLPNSRLLGTDRLSYMEQNPGLRQIFGDNVLQGFAKNHFDHYRRAGAAGLGIDTILLLEERVDLRIQVEATLSDLFGRNLKLEWDSGHLIAKVTLGGIGDAYRLDRDECHGIKELVVLLTHLYNHEHPYLIIDEPELNLHPQYQAFLMQEIRAQAGDRAIDASKKIIFLVTHSPFILDFRNIDDLRSIISFKLDRSVPIHLHDISNDRAQRFSSLIPRLNVHHKQLFFSDNPIFVEGIVDAQVVNGILESRGYSAAAAGSCIIDAGGCEEVNKYVELCLALQKESHFLYDLDSLFSGNLRACIRQDQVIQSFLSTIGVGNDFGRYCGQLDAALTPVIDALLAVPQVPQDLNSLLEFLRALGERGVWNNKQFAKARVAVLTAISNHRNHMEQVVTAAALNDIVGRRNQIVASLHERNIALLANGALETYLPSYTGNPYQVPDEAKQATCNAELLWLMPGRSDQELGARFGGLFAAVCEFPSKPKVNVDRVIKLYLARYIHDMQTALRMNPNWQLAEMQGALRVSQPSMNRIFSIQEIVRGDGNRFTATIVVEQLLNKPRRLVRISDATNAGMGAFEIEGVAVAGAA